MVEGKTKSGFKYKYDERIKTDWNFCEAIGILQEENTNIRVMRNVFEMLLGADGFSALKEHISKNNDGFVPMDVLTEEFKDIIADSTVKK